MRAVCPENKVFVVRINRGVHEQRVETHDPKAMTLLSTTDIEPGIVM